MQHLDGGSSVQGGVPSPVHGVQGLSHMFAWGNDLMQMGGKGLGQFQGNKETVLTPCRIWKSWHHLRSGRVHWATRSQLPACRWRAQSSTALGRAAT